MSSVKHNIHLNYGFEFISNLNFVQALWVPYLAVKGLTLAEIGLCESFFHVASLLFEVPTGLIADRFGRKLSRMLGIVSRLIYLFLLMNVKNLVMAMISFVFAALSYNLDSGADSAFVYDSMAELGTQHRFAEVQGRREVIFQVSSMIAVMAGGLMADVAYSVAIWATIAVFVIAFGIATFFKEPVIHEKTEKTTLKSLIKTSVQTLKEQPALGGLMLYTALFLSMAATFFMLLSAYLVGLGYSLSSIAFWYTANTFGSILAGLWVNRLIKRFDLNLIWVSSILLTISLFFMTVVPWGMAAFMVIGAMESILYVTMTHHINRQIASTVRATLLSVNAMAYSVIMVIVFPLVGWIGDLIGLRLAFLGSAAVMGILMVLFMLFQRFGVLTGPSFFGIMKPIEKE